jgi:membrane-associated phospholipid phosphatase
MLNKVVLLMLVTSLFFSGNTFAGSVDSLGAVSGEVIQPGNDSASVVVPAIDDTTKKMQEVVKGVVDSVVGDVKTPVKPKALSFRSVAIPVGLIGVGTLTAFSSRLQQANLFVREELYEDRRNQNQFRLDDYTLLAPAVAVYALNLAGIKGKNNFVDRSAMYVMSNAIANGLVFSTKKLAGVVRPDSSDQYSFPSGHTAAAFVSAEFLRQEYKDVSPWIGVAGYATAVATGVLRMYNNKHWLNDVVVGAGVGILSVRISYWLYPVIKNAILKKTGSARTNTMVMPTYQNGAFGVGMVTTF